MVWRGLTIYAKSLRQLVDFLKSEILQMVDMCNSVKLWIQLNIPRIEDGNNFGVSIQVW